MLNREQIQAFCEVAAEPVISSSMTEPWMWSARLVAFDSGATIIVTERGRDLLATVPHLPADAPASAAEATPCVRCHGSRGVPLFMGPASGGGSMPCPECAVEMVSIGWIDRLVPVSGPTEESERLVSRFMEIFDNAMNLRIGLRQVSP